MQVKVQTQSREMMLSQEKEKLAETLTNKEYSLAQSMKKKDKFQEEMTKIQHDLDEEVKRIHLESDEKAMAKANLAQEHKQSQELKETIKNLEEKVTLAQAHAKELEKGFSKKMTLAQEEKAALEKKVKKMEKEETQKELETNALITQTLADLKKYQNMDQMKEEEDKELRKESTDLKKKLDASKKTISSLDHQLSESMKRSMKVIGTFSDQLMHEKEKEVAALSQVVDTKSGMVKEKDQL